MTGRRFQELKHAAERAIWTLDAEYAARDVAACDVEDWANVVSDLRGKLGGSALKAGGGSTAKGRSTKKSAARR